MEEREGEGGEMGGDSAFYIKNLNCFAYFILYLKIMFDLLILYNIKNKFVLVCVYFVMVKYHNLLNLSDVQGVSLLELYLSYESHIFFRSRRREIHVSLCVILLCCTILMMMRIVRRYEI